MIESVRYTENGSFETVIDGQTVYVPDDMLNTDRQAIAAWVEAGGVIAPVVVPNSPAPTGTPRLIATGVFTISDGMMSGMETAVGISAAFPMGPGSYWIFFTETQPDLAYSYNVSASSGQINVTTRDTSFIEVTATDGGVPTDPVEISIQVARVQ